MPLAGENELSTISKDPQALLRIPLGAASPLWGLFAGAAMTGAAWWWMTRWTRPANLEAMFGAAEASGAADAARLEALAAPVVEAVEEAPATLEALVVAFERSPESVAEVATVAIEGVAEDIPPAPIAEALMEAAPEAIGGESAPISPVLEALTPEIVAPTVEPAPPVETALDALPDVAPELKPALKAKKPPSTKAD